MRGFGDQGAENERVETWRAEQKCCVQRGITKLHRTLESLRQRSDTQACHMHQVGQARATDLGTEVERFSGPCEKGK